MHRFLVIFMFCLLAVASVSALAQSGEASEQPHDSEWLADKTKVCAGCHGEGGVSESPTYPIIAGQYQDYLYHALEAYRDGARENGIMAAQVQGMTDAQLQTLAEYYANQESPLYTPSLGSD